MLPMEGLEQQMIKVKEFCINLEAKGTPETITKKAWSTYYDFKFGLNTIKNILPEQLANAKLNKVLEYKTIDSVHDKLAGKTTVCVAFGPSLRNNIKHLMKRRHRYNIICVDRAFYYLMDRKIKPKYVMCLDTKMSPEYIGNHSTQGITLLAHIGANHDYCRTWLARGGNIVFFVTEERYKSHELLCKESGINDLLYIAGNVGQGLMATALKALNVRKLVLVGYDNSFTDEWYYPDQKTDMDIAKGLQEKTIFEAINIYSEVVYTNQALLMYNRYMYLFLHNNNLMDKVVNCTEGGIFHIPNIKELLCF